MHKLSYYLRLCWLAVTYLLRKTYKANLCGHRTKRTGKLTSHGESHVMKMPLAENDAPDYCLECIGKMSIQCAWCCSSIHINDPITLYGVKDGEVIPDHAVRFQGDPTKFVGCLGWDCAESGGHRAGFWVPPGEVLRVQTPLEILMASGSDGMGVIIHDLGDQRNIGKVI
jgi:hypothetical protein